MAYGEPVPNGVPTYSITVRDRDNPALVAGVSVDSTSMSEPSVEDLDEFTQRLVDIFAVHPSLVLVRASRGTEFWALITPEELNEPPEPEIPPIDPPEEPDPGEPGPPEPENRAAV